MDGLIDTLKHSLCVALDAEDNVIDTVTIQTRNEELSRVIMDLVKISSRTSAGADYFDDKFEEISNEIKSLQGRLHEHEAELKVSESVSA